MREGVVEEKPADPLSPASSGAWMALQFPQLESPWEGHSLVNLCPARNFQLRGAVAGHQEPMAHSEGQHCGSRAGTWASTKEGHQLQNSRNPWRAAEI